MPPEGGEPGTRQRAALSILGTASSLPPALPSLHLMLLDVSASGNRIPRGVSTRGSPSEGRGLPLGAGQGPRVHARWVGPPWAATRGFCCLEIKGRDAGCSLQAGTLKPCSQRPARRLRVQLLRSSLRLRVGGVGSRARGSCRTGHTPACQTFVRRTFALRTPETASGRLRLPGLQHQEATFPAPDPSWEPMPHSFFPESSVFNLAGQHPGPRLRTPAPVSLPLLPNLPRLL